MEDQKKADGPEPPLRDFLNGRAMRIFLSHGMKTVIGWKAPEVDD